MSFYPILQAPGVSGWATLYNFPPNDWEIRNFGDKWINVTWPSNGEWLSENLGKLVKGGVRSVTSQEISKFVPDNTLALLSLTRATLPKRSKLLPTVNAAFTTMPAWRATLGLSSNSAQTSYQGELDSFPSPGSLLTFGPFLQFGSRIENYLILLNLEISAVSRVSELGIFDTTELVSKGSYKIRNNAVNLIPLDGHGFGLKSLPLIICKDMSGIPLYFSCTQDRGFLSLEHTHPPASLVVHGNRWEAQKLLKKRWFTKIETFHDDTR